MTNEETVFYQSIVEFLKKDPNRVGLVQHATTYALNEKINELRQCQADMETVASLALAPRLLNKSNSNKGFLAEKLRKWEHLWCLNWKSTIDKLEEKP